MTECFKPPRLKQSQVEESELAGEQQGQLS